MGVSTSCLTIRTNPVRSAHCKICYTGPISLERAFIFHENLAKYSYNESEAIRNTPILLLIDPPPLLREQGGYQVVPSCYSRASARQLQISGPELTSCLTIRTNPVRSAHCKICYTGPISLERAFIFHENLAKYSYNEHEANSYVEQRVMQ